MLLITKRQPTRSTEASIRMHGPTAEAGYPRTALPRQQTLAESPRHQPARRCVTQYRLLQALSSPVHADGNSVACRGCRDFHHGTALRTVATPREADLKAPGPEPPQGWGCSYPASSPNAMAVCQSPLSVRRPFFPQTAWSRQRPGP